MTHCTGEVWKALKALRDEFQAFVGQPGLLPGVMVVSAAETSGRRSWRQVAANRSGRHGFVGLSRQDGDDAPPLASR